MTTESRNMLETPSKFSFAPGKWPRWRKRFERYRVAVCLRKQIDKVQINTLFYVMGENAEDIFESIKWPEKAVVNTKSDADIYDKVIQKFEDYFIPRHNVIHDCYMFNKRHQQPGDGAEEFIIAFYTLSENCRYGAMRDDPRSYRPQYSRNRNE